ncbi:MAG TPA: type IV pilin N-terminal domain-containing protein [Methanocorpusculum sp.]|nr:type IV pilin N-terminal domain-containing protein [Methanocorpusculum sp.]
MKQNHSKKTMNKSLKEDDAVSSVVGEMLLLGIGVVLVAVFAVTLMGLLPGERDDYVDVVMNANTSTHVIELWHKGGDPISNSSLQVLVYHTSDPGTPVRPAHLVLNSTGAPSQLFDIGSCCRITVDTLLPGDQVRLTTGKTIIYSGEVQ